MFHRPISLLSNINKSLEKLIFKRVYKFLEDNGCLYNLQFGFRSKHSTNHARGVFVDRSFVNRSWRFCRKKPFILSTMKYFSINYYTMGYVVSLTIGSSPTFQTEVSWYQ